MPAFSPAALVHPIVQAPMGGGPSTPALAAAVSAAGGLGFLAAGYKAVDAVVAELGDLRSRLAPGTPFGVNVFAPPGRGSDAAQVPAYADTLRGEAERAGTALGEPRWDDDRYAAKLELLCGARIPVVSFTFGCPGAGAVERLHGAGTAVWVTATTAQEARAAVAAGADALVVQGVEAGGHRGGPSDVDGVGEYGLLTLLRLVRRTVDLPLVAAGGLMDGAAVAAVLLAGAQAAQLGTAFLLCPEAGTSAMHRDALGTATATALTRAFSGRRARGLVNRFLTEHSAAAPAAYPEVHHLTTPLRAAARAAGDGEAVNLWAGQGHALCEAVPAGELVRRIADDAAAALPR